MNETAFTRKLRDYVDDNGGGSYKIGASIFMEKGFPDTIFFLKGNTFLLESKVWPNKPTAIQLEQIRRIRSYGGYAWVCTLKDGIIMLDDVRFDSIQTMFTFIIKDINAKKTT